MSYRKRVLYTALDPVPGPKGASTHITYFLRALAEAGYQVTAVTARDGDQPAKEDFYGVRLIRVDLDGLPNFPARTKAFADRVLAEVDRTPYDIVHCRSLWDSYRLVALGLPAKLVFEVNGLPSVELKYHYPDVAESDLPSRLRRQEAAILARADAVICPSRVTRVFLRELGAPEDRLHVIPNGVDLSLFGLAESSADHDPGAAAVRSLVGDGTDPPSAWLAPSPEGDGPIELLYVGTFVSWQGLDTLVAALPQLRERGVHLRLVGRAARSWQKALLKQAQRLGVADLVAIDQPLEYYSIPKTVRQSSICIAPLAYCDRNVVQGCCPIKVLEYLACGKPVVAANLPVVRELVRDEVDALLFEPGDPKDLARQVLRFIDDPVLAQRLGESGRQRVASSFTWERAQRRLLKVYGELMNSSP